MSDDDQAGHRPEQALGAADTTSTAAADLERCLQRRLDRAGSPGLARCACGQDLSLTDPEQGEPLACPVCGAHGPFDILDQDEAPDAGALSAASSWSRQSREILLDPALLAQERADALLKRRRRRRRLTALALVILLSVGGALVRRHYRQKTRWISGGAHVSAIARQAVGMQARAGSLLENHPSGYHRALYVFTARWALGVLGRRPALRRQLPLLQNELAWFLLTTEDLELHDPVEALELAQEAVSASQLRRPALIDTYAEALFQNGRIAEAVEAERQAVSMRPDDAFLARQLEKFERALREQAAEAP